MSLYDMFLINNGEIAQVKLYIKENENSMRVFKIGDSVPEYEKETIYNILTPEGYLIYIKDNTYIGYTEVPKEISVENNITRFGYLVNKKLLKEYVDQKELTYDKYGSTIFP